MTSTSPPLRLPRLSPWARLALFIVAFFIVEMTLTELMSPFGLLGMLFSFAGIFGVVAFFSAFLDRRSFASIGLEMTRGGLAQFALGAALGVLMLCINLMVLAATGCVSSVHISSSASPLLIAYALGFLVQGSAEELMARGYLLQTLLTRYRAAVAITFQLLVFVGLHLLNPGVSVLAVVNLTIFAFGTSLAYLRLGSLWLPCGLHFAWNFTLSSVAGLHVSGVDVPVRLYETTLRGPSLLTGGEFGVEASVINTAVWLTFCFVCARRSKRYQQPTWWEQVRTLTRDQFGGVVVEELTEAETPAEQPGSANADDDSAGASLSP